MDKLNDLLHFSGMNFATGANAAVTQQGGADGGAAAGGGTPAAQPAAQPNAPGSGAGGDGIAQLRTAYESVKKEFEPYQKLNLKPEQITQYSGVYQKTYEQVATIGRQLGYPDDQIAEALHEDPVATLDFLRNEFQQRQQSGQSRQDNGQELNELVQSRIDAAIGPVQEWQNTQMTQAANAAFERTVYQMATDLYKSEGLDIANVPPDEMELLMSATSEILKYDEGALRALKYEGKTAPIQKAFTEAKTMLDKYFIARSQRPAGGQQRAAQLGRAPNGQFQPGGQQAKRPTLDEMIDNPALINQKYV
jgi:hypothetical protein